MNSLCRNAQLRQGLFTSKNPLYGLDKTLFLRICFHSDQQYLENQTMILKIVCFEL